jgi:hypothetical protein
MPGKLLAAAVNTIPELFLTVKVAVPLAKLKSAKDPEPEPVHIGVPDEAK